MKKKILLFSVVIFTVLVVFLYRKIVGPALPLPHTLHQVEYAVDNLQGADDYPFELDKKLLAEIVNKVEAGDYGNIHSLLIIHNDRLVLEKYFQGWTRHMLHPCFSATKSVTSALIGIAIEQGYINGVDETILSYFPEYNDIHNLDKRKESITLKDVLTMTAGFAWDEMNTPYLLAWRIPNPKNDAIKLGLSWDLIKSVLDLPISTPPGTKLVYNSACTLLLSGILKNKTGQSAERFAGKNLFNPLGITHWKWDTGPKGITLTSGGAISSPC